MPETEERLAELRDTIALGIFLDALKRIDLGEILTDLPSRPALVNDLTAIAYFLADAMLKARGVSRTEFRPVPAPSPRGPSFGPQG